MLPPETRILAQRLLANEAVSGETSLPPKSVLREVLDFYSPQAEQQGVVFSQRIETEGVIAGFKGEIVQVATNLLLNALAATPPVRRSWSIYILPLPGFARFTTIVGTAFLLPIRAAVLIRNTVRGYLSPFSPLKAIRVQALGCGCAQVSSTALAARSASGAHAGPVVQAHASRSSFPTRKVPTPRCAADTSSKRIFRIDN
jgi:hypothetical protein